MFLLWAGLYSLTNAHVLFLVVILQMVFHVPCSFRGGGYISAVTLVIKRNSKCRVDGENGECFVVEGIHRDVTSGEEKEPSLDMRVVREKPYD